MNKLFKVSRLMLTAVIAALLYLCSTVGRTEIVLKQPLPPATNVPPSADTGVAATENSTEEPAENEDDEEETDQFIVLNNAYKDYKRKRYDSAYHIFAFYAQRNNPHSMLAAGYLLGMGYGVAANYKEAEKYLQQAVKFGFPRGYYLLGLLELHKDGSGQFNLPAERLFNKAADLGDALAANMLANQYYRRGLFDRAVQWNNKAIQLGSHAAQKNKKIIDSGSQELAKTISTSSKTEYLQDLRAKSQSGDGQASYELARRYHKGVEVSVNFGEAIRLYRLAASQGNEQAKRILPILLSKQTQQGNLNTLWLQETATLVPTPSIILPSAKDRGNANYVMNKFNLAEDDPLDNLLSITPVSTNQINSVK
ncbi:hypothetical protein EDC44_101230 [Cricetibacter osteomyelitidis]|uniref:TPR repeat protein n=1 Tax=Cricetibacter osteomyelitidis TaxID=1521931 RepID=A0A4R2T5X0_9PAST|nr:tetratricopeptide repeat protein [Cricetibacter osteomyelitidis]TCP97840.1 hypothetical protein EDC44_101230 [Cricetibacter osteomyelitidis]